jgi:hypothetical protein
MASKYRKKEMAKAKAGVSASIERKAAYKSAASEKWRQAAAASAAAAAKNIIMAAWRKKMKISACEK